MSSARRFIVGSLGCLGELLCFMAALFGVCFLINSPQFLGPSRYQQGTTIIYAFPWWYILLVLLGSGIGLTWFWLWRKEMAFKLMLIILVLSLGGPLFFVPAIIYDHLRIEDDYFEELHDVIESTPIQVRFDDIKEVEAIFAMTPEGGMSYSKLVFLLHSGRIEKLQTGNGFTSDRALIDILERVRTHGVPVLAQKEK